MFDIEISVFPMRCHVDVLLLRIILYKYYHADHTSNTMRLSIAICGSNFNENKCMRLTNN